MSAELLVSCAGAREPRPRDFPRAAAQETRSDGPTWFKRLNMRKIIPYIASQFRKDKIWLRRTKPSKRLYQVLLAVDDSSSMADNHSKQVSQSVSQPASQSFSQLVSQPASQSVSQSFIQSASHSVSQSFSRSVSHSVSRSFSQSVSHSVSQSVSQSVTAPLLSF